VTSAEGRDLEWGIAPPHEIILVFDLEMAYFGEFLGAKFSFKNDVSHALAAC
jgi:hypothetical protein